MKTLLAVLLITSSLAFAQSTTPAPTPTDTEALDPNAGIHAEPFADLVKFTSGHGNGTDSGLRVPITGRGSLIADVLAVPAAGSTFQFGQGEYRVRLDHIYFLKNLKTSIPLNAMQLWVRGGLGTRRGLDIPHPDFAYTGQVGLSVAFAKVGSIPAVLDFRAGYIGSAGVKLPLFTNTGTAAIGISLRP